MKPIFDHHTITNKPHKIQIRLENRMKPVGHYTALRHKIIRVGGNLPLVAQFRVLCRPGLLTTQHFFLFLFLFPLCLPFLLLFSSFLSSLSLLLSSLSLFPSSSSLLLPPRIEIELPQKMNWNPLFIGFKRAMHDDTWHAICHTHGLPCATHMACHVSYMHRPLPCNVTHGLPCVTHMVCHVSPTWLAMCLSTPVVSKYVKFRMSRNPTKFDWVARFHEIIPTVQSVSSSEI